MANHAKGPSEKRRLRLQLSKRCEVAVIGDACLGSWAGEDRGGDGCVACELAFVVIPYVVGSTVS